ncbi:unnamed protein product [Amoebophrya sp. A25]|nr:unnamed protein product [Amoebophrya sp. A25]|eukprot:GSA25T00027916001.1
MECNGIRSGCRKRKNKCDVVVEKKNPAASKTSAVRVELFWKVFHQVLIGDKDLLLGSQLLSSYWKKIWYDQCI